MYKKVNNTSASLMKNQFITKKRVKGFLENELSKEIHFCRLKIICTMQCVQLDS